MVVYDSGRFPGPVRTEEGKQFSLFNIELDTVYGHQGIKHPGQVEGTDGKVIAFLS
jgi:hypothetical protein